MFFQGYPWLISMYRGGPFAAILPGLSTKLFGVSAISCCLPSLIAGVLVVALTYTFGGVLFNRRVGLIAAAVVAVSAPSVLMSRFVSMPVDFFFVLTIYTFYRYIREKKLYLGVVTSLVFTVGIMTRQTILLCIPICLFIAWRYDKNLSFLKSKDFLLLTLPFWIIAYPYLLFAFFQGQFTDVAIGYTALLTDTFSASGLLWFGIPYYINAIFTYFSPLNFLLFVSVAAELEAVEETVKNIPDIVESQIEAGEEPGSVAVNLKAAENVDIRKAVFSAFAEANQPLLMMRPIDMSLEEIFLDLTRAEVEL